MARAIKNANLQTRSARKKLARRREPYWCSISQGRHIGYRCGASGGSWFARYWNEERYVHTRLGTADDIEDADGVEVLDFETAQEHARRWFKEQTHAATGMFKRDGYTVADAVEDYLDHYAVNGRSDRDMRYRIDAFILPELGSKKVAKLSPKTIRRWHRDLAERPARLRSAKGSRQAHRKAPQDEESRRKRRHSANKVLTILTASLNHAYNEGLVSSDHAWRRVKPFTDVDQPRIRFPVSDDEPGRLVQACTGNFQDLVRGALLTGGRYSELANLCVEDFDAAAGSVFIRAGKTGKSRHVALTDEGLQFFERITADRPGSELIFVRTDGKPWGKSHQRRPMLEACKEAGIRPAVSFHVLRHWYAAALVKAGVPISIVAENLGHADPKITARHYGHLSPAQRGHVIRRHMADHAIAEAAHS